MFGMRRINLSHSMHHATVSWWLGEDGWVTAMLFVSATDVDEIILEFSRNIITCNLIGVGSVEAWGGGGATPPPPSLPTVYIMNSIAVL